MISIGAVVPIPAYRCESPGLSIVVVEIIGTLAILISFLTVFRVEVEVEFNCA